MKSYPHFNGKKKGDRLGSCFLVFINSEYTIINVNLIPFKHCTFFKEI